VVFKRRNQRTWMQVIADGIYPKGGWRRAASYVFHRLRRLPDPPHKIARGIAVGVFVSFTPFFGFHFVLASLLAMIMQGNILASLLATFFGNPLTFPIIATVSLELGSWMLGTEGGVPFPHVVAAFSRATVELWWNFTAMFTDEITAWHRMSDFLHGVFLPYLAGGILPGTVSGVVAYMLALPAVSAYQKRRVKRLQARYQKRRAALAASKQAATRAE